MSFSSLLRTAPAAALPLVVTSWSTTTRCDAPPKAPSPASAGAAPSAAAGAAAAGTAKPKATSTAAPVVHRHVAHRHDTAPPPTREEAVAIMLSYPTSPDTLEELQAEGLTRRDASGCPFCASMLERPCGAFYVDWDDCVNVIKKAPGGDDPASGKSFVQVCSVFTKAMMHCMQDHADDYPEMQPGYKGSQEQQQQQEGGSGEGEKSGEAGGAAASASGSAEAATASGGGSR
jgi:hypothetical protein